MAAVQALYQIEQSGAVADLVLEEFLEFRLDTDAGHEVAPHEGLLSDLVKGVDEEFARLDDIIRDSLTDPRTHDRMPFVLRAILRAGIHELRICPETPARVVIDEYVDVTHAFFGGPEPGMVNGVLDHVARVVRPGEFASEAGAAPGDGL